MRHADSRDVWVGGGDGVWLGVVWHWLPTSEYSLRFGWERGAAWKGLRVKGEIILDWLLPVKDLPQVR